MSHGRNRPRRTRPVQTACRLPAPTPEPEKREHTVEYSARSIVQERKGLMMCSSSSAMIVRPIPLIKLEKTVWTRFPSSARPCCMFHAHGRSLYRCRNRCIVSLKNKTPPDVRIRLLFFFDSNSISPQIVRIRLRLWRSCSCCVPHADSENS
jgi:hypothetical protein